MKILSNGADSDVSLFYDGYGRYTCCCCCLNNFEDKQAMSIDELTNHLDKHEENNDFISDNIYMNLYLTKKNYKKYKKKLLK